MVGVADDAVLAETPDVVIPNVEVADPRPREAPTESWQPLTSKSNTPIPRV
jgi:hypothetical protein